MEFTSSKVCNAKEQVKFLQIKIDVLSSKDFPAKKGYFERVFNWSGFSIVIIKELGK